jgi:hypothetical protein
MNLAFVYKFNRLGIDIDAENINAAARQYGSRWQANITESHNNDFLIAGRQKRSPIKGLPVITLVLG